jgi:hypothetical protein
VSAFNQVGEQVGEQRATGFPVLRHAPDGEY